MSDIESAKNFIWEFMSDTSKSFLITVSKMTKDERLKKYNHNHEVFFDADVKDKVIIKECARLQALKNWQLYTS